MGSITLNKPSGGQLTLSPEDSATNETVTIPSVGVGKVLQVVENSESIVGHYTTTSTSWVAADSRFELSITPLRADSKIIIQLSIGMQYSGSNADVRTKLYRDGNALISDNYGGYLRAMSSVLYSPFSAHYIDSPNTTSEVKYRPYVMTGAGSTVYYVHGGSHYTITAMEVAQ